MKVELEIQCPECGGAVMWTESQITGTCAFCGSLLFFEPDIEHYFYIPPVVCTDEQVRQCIILNKADLRPVLALPGYGDPVFTGRKSSRSEGISFSQGRSGSSDSRIRYGQME